MLRFFAIALAFFIAATAVQAATPTQNADLSATLTDSPDPVRQGESLTTPEARAKSASTPKLGGRGCYRSIDVDGITKEERLQPALTPVEMNGVWVVALPQGFQDLMPGSNSSHHIGVLLTAIDQPNFPDWIKLKRAVFTQGEVAGITQGEVQQELLLGQDQEACRPVRRYGIEKNEKLLCAAPLQVRFISSFPIAMHLMFEDSQGHSFEIVDEFCSATAM